MNSTMHTGAELAERGAPRRVHGQEYEHDYPNPPFVRVLSWDNLRFSLFCCWIFLDCSLILLVFASISLAKVKKIQTLAKKYMFLIQMFECSLQQLLIE